MSGSRSCHHHHQPHQCSTACSPVHYTVVRHTLHSFERVIRVNPSQLGVTSELWDGQKWQCWWDACNGRDLCSLSPYHVRSNRSFFFPMVLSLSLFLVSLPPLVLSPALATLRDTACLMGTRSAKVYMKMLKKETMMMLHMQWTWSTNAAYSVSTVVLHTDVLPVMDCASKDHSGSSGEDDWPT